MKRKEEIAPWKRDWCSHYIESSGDGEHKMGAIITPLGIVAISISCPSPESKLKYEGILDFTELDYMQNGTNYCRRYSKLFNNLGLSRIACRFIRDIEANK